MPSEPSLRRLGVGGGGGGDRPLRAQLIVAVVVVFVILSVPVYLLRHPSGKENKSADAGASANAAALLPPGSSGSPASLDAGVDDERVKLGALMRVKCSAGRRAQGQEGTLCDRLDGLEDAFMKGIRDNVDCAPKIAKGGSINYVLTVDFTDRRVHVFPGASGAWKGPSARKAADCVKRALPAIDWTTQKHQYRYYMLAVMATYPSAAEKKAARAPAAPTTSAGAPLFE